LASGNKQIRHSAIREILRNEDVDTHERLAEVLLRQRIVVSQSTLSKDLRELGVVRMPRPDGGFRYAVPEVGVTLRDQNILERELRDYLTDADLAGNMVVVHTLSGHAQSVCEALDRIGWQEILGTIAGENTIFILARTSEAAAGILARIREIGGKRVD